jgi:hypothetical protein
VRYEELARTARDGLRNVTMISMDKDWERIDSAVQDSLSAFAKLLK